MSTIAELTALVRLRGRDKSNPPLYSDADILSALREAEQEACRRALILLDTTTNAICHYKVTANQEFVKLDQRVLRVRRVELWTPNDDDPLVIRKDKLSKLIESSLPSYWQTIFGDPEGVIVDLKTMQLRLVPIPLHNATLRIQAIRLPLVPMEETPEIPARYHNKLVPWVLSRMASMPDNDLYDKQFAADSLAEFTAEFGPAPSAIDDVWAGNREKPRRSHTRFF